MSTPQPHVEIIHSTPQDIETAQTRPRRWKVFLIVFAVCSAIGLAIVYGRAPVYQASATVLTVKPKAIDQPSTVADSEHVAIQRRLLLGENVIARLMQGLRSGNDTQAFSDQSLREILAAVPIPETNMLELQAEGSDPSWLRIVIDHWVASYQSFRAEEVDKLTARTSQELIAQQESLAAQIEQKRAELALFRETHDIISMERDENRALASLKGLNRSLNKAREELIATQAKRSAIAAAIANGEPVIPTHQREEIARMKLDLKRGHSRLTDLRDKYTQRYLDRDPDLAELPTTLEQLESDLAAALTLASQQATDEAEQDYQTAQRAVATIESELAAQQASVQQFTTRFKEFKSLENELGRLEEFLAENQARLAQIQIRNSDEYPSIEVIAPAQTPSKAIYPDYNRDLAIALGAAFAIALFATWLVEYLGGRSATHVSPQNVGVRIYAQREAQALTVADERQQLTVGNTVERLSEQALPGRNATQLPPINLPRDLAPAEVNALLAELDDNNAACCALLLSGIAPSEVVTLRADHFDDRRQCIAIPGSSAREMAFEPKVWERAAPVAKYLRGSTAPVSLASLDLAIVSAAREASLSDPAGVDALVLWHSYVMYLVRQGADQATLFARVGAIAPEILDALSAYAPTDMTPTEHINTVYPSLA